MCQKNEPSVVPGSTAISRTQRTETAHAQATLPLLLPTHACFELRKITMCDRFLQHQKTYFCLLVYPYMEPHPSSTYDKSDFLKGLYRTAVCNAFAWIQNKKQKHIADPPSDAIQTRVFQRGSTFKDSYIFNGDTFTPEGHAIWSQHSKLQKLMNLFGAEL